MDRRPYALSDLLYLMSRLRSKEDGCPWDIKQDFKSIAPSTLEEAFEVVDAIEKEDFDHLREELGDLLFQVIFYAQLGDEKDYFDFPAIVDGLTAKLVRRHPHVFPDGTLKSRRSKDLRKDDDAIKASWEAIKEEERREKGKRGVFDDVPVALPAISRAAKLQKRAAKQGFDWPDKAPVLDKLREELEELEQACADQDEAAMAEELGDLMFTCVNLSRHIKRDPEQLLRQANRKFEQRFRYVNEQITTSGDETLSLDELERHWQAAKSEQGN